MFNSFLGILMFLRCSFSNYRECRRNGAPRTEVSEARSSFLFFLYQLLKFLMLPFFVFVPLFIIDVPWWIGAIIFLVCWHFDAIGSIIYIVMYIWSFIVALQSPITPFLIFYFILFIWYVVEFILKFIFAKKSAK